MFMKNVAAIVGAAILGVGAASTLAAGTLEEESPKKQACNSIGCPDGQRACGTVSGTGSIPGFASVTITYQCYEPEYGSEI